MFGGNGRSCGVQELSLSVEGLAWVGRSKLWCGWLLTFGVAFCVLIVDLLSGGGLREASGGRSCSYDVLVGKFSVSMGQSVAQELGTRSGYL